MDNFKLASRQKLRVQTSRGLLPVENLWDLDLPELDALAVSLETEHEQSGKKSFLRKTKASEKDKTAKLKFDVVLDILTTKAEEAQAATEAAERKEKNRKLLTLIAEKNDDSLKKKTVRQLEAMLEPE